MRSTVKMSVKSVVLGKNVPFLVYGSLGDI